MHFSIFSKLHYQRFSNSYFQRILYKNSVFLNLFKRRFSKLTFFYTSTGFSSPVSSEPDNFGFGSEKDFEPSIPSESESESDKVSIEDEPVSRCQKPFQKPKFHQFHQKHTIKIERDVSPEPIRLHTSSNNEEVYELFEQLKALVPDTLIITLLQTATALVKAGFTESMGWSVNRPEVVKREKPDIKQEPSLQSCVKNRRNFFALGRNRHIAKLKMIKKKGLYHIKNLLKFEVNKN